MKEVLKFGVTMMDEYCFGGSRWGVDNVRRIGQIWMIDWES
jgi:hypothetical protein